MAPNLSPHYQNPWLRQLPHYRTFLPGTLHSMKVYGEHSASLGRRRLAFLIIVMLRAVQWFWFAFVCYYRYDHPSSQQRISLSTSVIFLAAWLVASVLAAWNLHLITEAEEGRRVWRVSVPGFVFTAYLWWLVVVHVFLMSLEISGLTYFYGSTVLDWVFWLGTVLVVAWVSGRGKDDGRSGVFLV